MKRRSKIPEGSVFVKVEEEGEKIILVFRDILGEEFYYIVEGENLKTDVRRDEK